jgi:hypothetical protein
MKRIFAFLAVFLFAFLFVMIGQSADAVQVNAQEVTTTAEEETTTVTTTTTFGITVPSDILTDPLYQDIIQNETAQQIATLLGISVGTLALILVGLFIAIKWLKNNYLGRRTTNAALGATYDQLGTAIQTTNLSLQQSAVTTAEVEQLKPLLLVIGEGLFQVISTSPNARLNQYAPEFQAKYASAISIFTQPIAGVDKAVKLAADETLRLARKPLPEVLTDAVKVMDALKNVKDAVKL